MIISKFFARSSANRHQIDTRSTLASLLAMEDSAGFRLRFWRENPEATHYLE